MIFLLPYTFFFFTIRTLRLNPHIKPLYDGKKMSQIVEQKLTKKSTVYLCLQYFLDTFVILLNHKYLVVLVSGRICKNETLTLVIYFGWVGGGG